MGLKIAAYIFDDCNDDFKVEMLKRFLNQIDLESITILRSSESGKPSEKNTYLLGSKASYENLWNKFLDLAHKSKGVDTFLCISSRAFYAKIGSVIESAKEHDDEYGWGIYSTGLEEDDKNLATINLQEFEKGVNSVNTVLPYLFLIKRKILNLGKSKIIGSGDGQGIGYYYSLISKKAGMPVIRNINLKIKADHFKWEKRDLSDKFRKDYINELENFIKIKDLREISVLDQLDNNRILELPYTKKDRFFNSCIFNYKGKDLIMSRKEALPLSYVRLNTICLFDLKSKNEIPLEIIDEHDDEQYEDPRVFVRDKMIYVSCVSYIEGDTSKCHQKIMVFNESLKHVDNIHIDYGKNGSSLIKCSGVEKNWTYFVQNDSLFCVYNVDPHTVLEVDWNGKIKNETKSFSRKVSDWKYGHARAGSNPIFYNGEYHCFFHSSLPWRENGQRRYFMGYLKFEKRHPFTISYIKPEPLLWGNEKDEKDEDNPLVVFPCGALINRGDFIISYGLNDEKTGLVKINSKIL